MAGSDTVSTIDIDKGRHNLMHRRTHVHRALGLLLLISCAKDLAGIPSDGVERLSQMIAEDAHEAAQALERSSASSSYISPFELLRTGVRHACRKARQAVRVCLQNDYLSSNCTEVARVESHCQRSVCRAFSKMMASPADAYSSMCDALDDVLQQREEEKGLE